MTRNTAMRVASCWALVVPLLVCTSAHAQEINPPKVGELVSFIRWGGVLISVGVILGASVVVRLLHSSVDSLGRRFNQHRLTLQKVESFTRFFVYIVTASIVIALSFQLTETVLALVGGTLAVAVGFSLRDLVAAMIAGVTIMLDRPFQVGDRVLFAGEYGDVTAIGLRSIRIQTLDDNTVTIPNNKVLTDVTSCGNYGALDMQVGLDFYIGVDQDLERAEAIIKEAMLSSQYVFLEKPIVVLVKQVIKDNYVAVHLRVKGYVLDTRYEKAFETDVSKRVLRAFAERQILPPAVLHRVAGADLSKAMRLAS